VALACEVVSEDHITRSKTARGAIADPDFHLPHENKNVLSPGRGVPIAPIVRRETAEHEVGTRLKRNVVALLGRQREIFKMGLAVVARIYPYDHARAPSHREIREIIVYAKAYSASSPTTKPLASLLRTLPPDIPRIPRLLSTIFRLPEVRRNEIRSQPIPLAAKPPGCPPRSAGTRCFAFIKAHLCRRRLSHQTPSHGHAGAGGARSWAISDRISWNMCRGTATSAIWTGIGQQALPQALCFSQ
jgi:hypothetical protein